MTRCGLRVLSCGGCRAARLPGRAGLARCSTISKPLALRGVRIAVARVHGSLPARALRRLASLQFTGRGRDARGQPCSSPTSPCSESRSAAEDSSSKPHHQLAQFPEHDREQGGPNAGSRPVPAGSPTSGCAERHGARPACWRRAPATRRLRRNGHGRGGRAFGIRSPERWRISFIQAHATRRTGVSRFRPDPPRGVTL